MGETKSLDSKLITDFRGGINKQRSSREV